MWFQWVLIVVVAGSIVSRLVRLGGWEPQPSKPYAIGICLLFDAFLIVGIVLWL